MNTPIVTTASHPTAAVQADRASGRGRLGGHVPPAQTDLASEFQSTLQQAQEQDIGDPRAGRERTAEPRRPIDEVDDASVEASADEQTDDADAAGEDVVVSEDSYDDLSDEVIADTTAAQVVAEVTTELATEPTTGQATSLQAQAAPAAAIASDTDEPEDAAPKPRTPAIDPATHNQQKQATGNESNQSAMKQLAPEATLPNTPHQPSATAAPAIATAESAAPAAPAPAAAAQHAAPAPAMPQIDAPDPNISRLARALQSGINQNGGSVTLRMHPPELGVVKIDMQVRAGVVTATFHAEHPSIQNLLNHEMSQLRQALQSQGLVVDRLEVRVRDATDANTARQDQSNGESPSDGRSRGHAGQGNGQTGRDAETSERAERLSRRSFSRLLNTVG